MPQVIERTVYKLNELSDCAKDRARDRQRNGDYPLDNWWNNVYEDAIQVSKRLGIKFDTKDKNTPAIYFTLSYSQGDGASFEGYWEPTHDLCKAIINYAPLDTELLRIAEGLTLLRVNARLKGYTLYGRITPSFYHFSNTITSVLEYTLTDTDEDSPSEDDNEQFLTLMQNFADWIHRQLYRENEYLCSDEYIDEYLTDDKFDEDGNMI